MAPPAQDAIGATLGFATLLVGVLFLKADDNADVGVPLIVGGSTLIVGSYVSGGIGYFRVQRCRKAITEFEQAHPPVR